MQCAAWLTFASEFSSFFPLSQFISIFLSFPLIFSISVLSRYFYVSPFLLLSLSHLFFLLMSHVSVYLVLFSLSVSIYLNFSIFFFDFLYLSLSRYLPISPFLLLSLSHLFFSFFFCLCLFSSFFSLSQFISTFFFFFFDFLSL